MRSFWGRGAIAMAALLAVVAFGSFLAGENLTKIGSSHVSATQQQPTGSAATSVQRAPASRVPAQQPRPGRGHARPHRGDWREGFTPVPEMEEP